MLTFQHVVNIENINEITYILLFFTKSLKSKVYFTLTARFN